MSTRTNRSEQVVLVDASDTVTGSAEKWLVHQRGLLHRAFSVFVMNARGEFLLQKRARGKYHSGGLWSNACCGHPRPGELVQSAARRRLGEEMGFTCALEQLQSFTYYAKLAEGVIEHEVDHVFVGRSDDLPEPDRAEVEDWRWQTRAVIDAELAQHPTAFTAWFPPAWSIVKRWLDGRSDAQGAAGDYAA